MFLRFGLAAAIGFTFNVGGVYVLEHWMDWPPKRAFGTCLTVVYGLNFLLARYFVFNSRSPMVKQVLQYLVLSLLFRTIEYCFFAAMLDRLAIPGAALAFLTLSASMLIKFSVYRLFIFQTRTPIR